MSEDELPRVALIAEDIRKKAYLICPDLDAQEAHTEFPDTDMLCRKLAVALRKADEVRLCIKFTDGSEWENGIKSFGDDLPASAYQDWHNLTHFACLLRAAINTIIDREAAKADAGSSTDLSEGVPPRGRLCRADGTLVEDDLSEGVPARKPDLTSDEIGDNLGGHTGSKYMQWDKPLEKEVFADTTDDTLGDLCEDVDRLEELSFSRHKGLQRRIASLAEAVEGLAKRVAAVEGRPATAVYPWVLPITTMPFTVEGTG